MSNIKFLAAKELIQEGKYDEARGILFGSYVRRSGGY